MSVAAAASGPFDTVPFAGGDADGSWSPMSPHFASWLPVFGLLNVVYGDAEHVEKCYSCSSANFEHRWPRSENSTYLFLRDYPIMANENCDHMKSELPVVPCPDSVCVKFVVQEHSANRAVCTAMQSPVIVRDCWSRVVGSADPDLRLRPLEDRPVSLDYVSDVDRVEGSVFTCTGYLCNSSPGSRLSFFGAALSIILAARLM